MAADNLALELEEPVPPIPNGLDKFHGTVGKGLENGVCNGISNGTCNGGTGAAPSGKGRTKDQGVLYQVNDTPPWYLCLILGFQHYLTMMGGTVSYPFLLAPRLCLGDDDPDRAHLLSTILFVSGLGTLLQATFGVRLPVIQGSTFAHLVPILAVLSLPQWQCHEGDNDWKARMREVSCPALGDDSAHPVERGFKIFSVAGNSVPLPVRVALGKLPRSESSL